MDKPGESYMYLIFNLFFLFIFVIGLTVFRNKKEQILFSSFFALPQAFLALTLVPVYWNPQKIPFLGVGLEDFLFCFLTGGLVWISVLVFFNKRIVYNFNWGITIIKLVVCIGFGIVFLTLLYFMNIRNIINPFMIMIFWSGFVLILHQEYWKIGLSGALLFSVIYSLSLKIMIIFWPTFISFWTFKNLSNLTLLRLPIEEMVWAFLYGGSWSLAIAYILDISIQPEKQLIKE